MIGKNHRELDCGRLEILNVSFSDIYRSIVTVQPIEKEKQVKEKFNKVEIEVCLAKYLGGNKLHKTAEKLFFKLNENPNILAKFIWVDKEEYVVIGDKENSPFIVNVKELTDDKIISNILENLLEEDDLKTFLAEMHRIKKTTLFDSKNKNSKTKYTNIIESHPTYIPNGFVQTLADYKPGIFQVADQYGNVFVWVPGRILKTGKVVKGFYISKYEISKGIKDSPMSVPNQLPWNNVTYFQAKSIAEKFGGKLITNEQYDSVCEMISEIIGEDLVYKDSKDIGYYYDLSLLDRENFVKKSDKVNVHPKVTGGQEFCGICNLAGNCWTWTDSICMNSADEDVISMRGGSISNLSAYNMAFDQGKSPSESSEYISFRIVL